MNTVRRNSNKRIAEDTVLSTTSFITPMPAVTEDALTLRGVLWPICGFAPGLYSGRCRKCGETFTGAKRSLHCLPCALALTVEAARIGRIEIDEARQDGRQSVLDEVRRLGERPSGSILTPIGDPERPS